MGFSRVQTSFFGANFETTQPLTRLRLLLLLRLLRLLSGLLSFQLLHHSNVVNATGCLIPDRWKNRQILGESWAIKSSSEFFGVVLAESMVN